MNYIIKSDSQFLTIFLKQNPNLDKQVLTLPIEKIPRPWIILNEDELTTCKSIFNSTDRLFLIKDNC